jgi:hypothetical protein
MRALAAVSRPTQFACVSASQARRAEAAGVALITVHGRTRCQFYKGQADWAAIGAVKAAVGTALPAQRRMESDAVGEGGVV